MYRSRPVSGNSTSRLDCDFDPESLGIPSFRPLLPLGGQPPPASRTKRARAIYDQLIKDYRDRLAVYKGSMDQAQAVESTITDSHSVEMRRRVQKDLWHTALLFKLLLRE